MDLSLVLLVLALIPSGLRLPGVDAKTRAPKEPPITALPRQFHEDHRLLPWCVNGIDEPEFKKYPWNEFVPILQRRYFVDNVEANQRYAYSTHMYPIQINMTGTPPGSGGSLYQRGHFVLKTSLRKEFATNVQLQYNFTKIEGLIVQANFAPYGVGLPMGTFVHPKLFNCVDCRKPVGIPIACRRRTHMHIMHPTIMAYHHKMKIPQEEKDRQKSYCYAQLIPSQCIIIDFKNTTNNVTGLTLVYHWDTAYKQYKYKPLPGMATPCQTDADCNGDKDNPTGHLIQSWFDSDCCPTKDNGKCNLTATTSGPAVKVKKHCPNFKASGTDVILENPREQSDMYPVFKCRPFETTVCRPVGFPKVPRYETKDSFQTDYTISTAPAIPSSPAGPGFDPFDDDQTCCLGASPSPAPCPAPPPSAPPGPPPGKKRCPQADPAKGIANTECVKRVVLPVDKDDEPDWSWSTAPKDEEKKCDDLLNEDEYGTSNEIHGNFVWYTPPCRPNNVLVSFQMLIVHNFQKGLYAIQTSEPFKLKAGSTSGADINAHIPTPLFTGFPHFCDTPVDSPSYLYERPDQTPFDFSRSYDACVQNITGTKYVNEQVCPGRVPLFTLSTGKKKRGGKPATYTSDIPKCDKNADGTYLPCVTNTCPELPKTTPEYVATPGKGILKRTLHGGINIITNFCIMPICVFIARFYKETYNMQSFKGQKTWYWMHMLGAGGSTLFMYMGYFTDKLVDTSDAHLVYGNLYIICLGLSYMTAWIRHKNRWISMIVESIHSCCGYGCFILALICVTNAKQHEEPISDEVKYVVYVAIASLTIFYVGMTIHICSMDRKFGMKPKRWHFPSVESRFDDLPVPGRNIRKIFIFAVLFINLPLTLSTLFL